MMSLIWASYLHLSSKDLSKEPFNIVSSLSKKHTIEELEEDISSIKEVFLGITGVKINSLAVLSAHGNGLNGEFVYFDDQNIEGTRFIITLP